MVIQGITMVKCMVKCMVHQPHQGGNYQVNSEFMGICFFVGHHIITVIPWYYHVIFIMVKTIEIPSQLF